jgi:hypothetical protein
MRLVFKTLLFLLQVVIFVAVAGVSSKAFSYLTAKNYLAGETPWGPFPMVAVQVADAGSRAPEYRLVRWSALEEIKKEGEQLVFKLPQKEGRFELARQGEFVPYVSFKVLESTPNSQLIEVDYRSDDYDFVSRYITDGNSVQPKYYFVWGASTVMVGLIPGLISGWFVGWWVRRKWPQYSDAVSPG